MMALAILFGFNLFMSGGAFAARHGRPAQELGLAGSEWISHVFWIALAGYATAVWAVRRIKRTRTRWIVFGLVTLIAHTVVGYPTFLLDHGSTRIPVEAFMSLESRALFEKRYPVKYVCGSAPSHDGADIIVRRDQYSAEMAAFAADLVKRQAGQD